MGGGWVELVGFVDCREGYCVGGGCGELGEGGGEAAFGEVGPGADCVEGEVD